MNSVNSALICLFLCKIKLTTKKSRTVFPDRFLEMHLVQKGYEAAAARLIGFYFLIGRTEFILIN